MYGPADKAVVKCIYPRPTKPTSSSLSRQPQRVQIREQTLPAMINRKLDAIKSYTDNFWLTWMVKRRSLKRIQRIDTRSSAMVNLTSMLEQEPLPQCHEIFLTQSQKLFTN